MRGYETDEEREHEMEAGEEETEAEHEMEAGEEETEALINYYIRPYHESWLFFVYRKTDTIHIALLKISDSLCALLQLFNETAKLLSG